ncbi:SIR2 family protein [Rhodococcoides fascians]|uniref:SIR2 family protein n=1 Tax=Rhodococcoides fascians TaxID=1828 RepID=UPI0024B8BEC1|nr:SIR2 family protein [Rhodococcus fascians]MDJ0412077.1 SIR2 family protein [Rhodococcus fascians]
MTNTTPGGGSTGLSSSDDSANLTGHVFVVKGRLESVASDVIIVPADFRFQPERTWWPALGVADTVPAAHGSGRARRFPHPQGRPTWILNVAHDGGQSVAWLIAGLSEAFQKIQADPPKHGDGRVRPLIAMPILGVGLGGYEGVRGEVIQSLLSRTSEFVNASNFDVVFVVGNAADYAALQSIRRQQERVAAHPASEELATKIRSGDVALLLGAGVSVSAGLPTWDQLLTTIKHDTQSSLDDKDFAAMNVLDRAQLLSKTTGDRSLGERAAAATGASSTYTPTLAHCLLASLNVSHAVTTNYDTLYEDAYESAHGKDSISVLPREDAVAGRAWLLKMHGDVADPDSIILSRRDFVRYDSQRRPLASIVQSLMATGHLVVIGASMTDDNVLRLAHEVLAMNATNSHQRPLGTVVTLQPDALRAALWEGDFDYVTASKSLRMQVAARDLEILLDGVAMYASDQSPYLLDSRYAELLDGDENRVADELREVASRIRSFRSTNWRHRWEPFQKALTAMGEAEPPRVQRDRFSLSFGDLVDAYFSAAEHKNHVAVLRDYHNLRRDILADLFGCPLPDHEPRVPRRSPQGDRESVLRHAHQCLEQASALSSPFGFYMEGAPGPLESGLRSSHMRSLSSAVAELKMQYRATFETALRILYPGADRKTFQASTLATRGLGDEPTDPWDFN